MMMKLALGANAASALFAFCAAMYWYRASRVKMPELTGTWSEPIEAVNMANKAMASHNAAGAAFAALSAMSMGAAIILAEFAPKAG